jgi:formimidoylglutamase
MTDSDAQGFLHPVAHDIVFSRHDPDDRRVGDIVKRATLEDVEKTHRDLIIVGIPDDRGVVAEGGRAGAAHGPTEIRKAFTRLTLGDHNQLSRLHLADVGDLRLAETLEESHCRAEAVIRRLFETTKARLLVLGGGHDLAYPHFSALIESAPHGERVGIVNIDAHFDVRPVKETFSSGTPFWRLLEKGDDRFRGRELVQIGALSQVNSLAHRRYLEDRGAGIIMFEDRRYRGHEAALHLSLDDLARRAKTLGVSFDMDAVRMSDARGVSAPSPIGLSGSEAIHACFAAGEHKRVRTLGIYEVAPPLDDGSAVRLAALMCHAFAMGIAAAEERS